MSTVLSLNVGSSSIKCALFHSSSEGLNEVTRTSSSDDTRPLAALLSEFTDEQPSVVAHRLVHGGPELKQATVVDDALLAVLEGVVPLAPLHLPPALDVVRQARALFPNAMHVACFDTAFHRTLPIQAYTYALPSDFVGTDVRRYGFHGLSCEHVVTQLGPDRTARCVIAHLGSGCSITAVRDGQSIDNSMGFTPSGGVVMATRSGDLDPGVLLYLLAHGRTTDDLSSALNHRSGLSALGGSADMRELLSRDDGDARLAVDIFCYRITQFIGAYATTLGGIDTLAFTGGIGEHAHGLRSRIVDSLEVFRPFEVAVIAADEELVMAQQAAALLS